MFVEARFSTGGAADAALGSLTISQKFTGAFFD